MIVNKILNLCLSIYKSNISLAKVFKIHSDQIIIKMIEQLF
jgi:hypothetical protein